MQTITKKQLSTIAKTITKLSSEEPPLKHATVLEIFAKGLGYRDYNALYIQLEQETSDNIHREKTQEAFSEEVVESLKEEVPDFKIILEQKKILKASNTALYRRKSEDIPWEEFKTLTHTYEKAKDDYRVLVLKYVEYVKNIPLHQGQTCPKCLGKGGKDIAVEALYGDAMWFDDGVAYELGFEKCPMCFGGGRATNRIIQAYKKAPSFYKEEISDRED